MKVITRPDVRRAVDEDINYADSNLRKDLASGVYTYKGFALPLGLTRKQALGVAVAICTVKLEVGMNRISELGPHSFNQYITLLTDEANYLMREEIVERKEK